MQAKPHHCKSNVSKTQHDAIISLRKNKQIVIFEADKGGAVVVTNKSDHITEAKKHLNSVDADGNRIYTELTVNCTEKFVRNVRNAVQNAVINNVINDDLSDLLIIDDPKPGNIYFLPKIHKNVSPPPGRPICNTINTPTMNLSKWVDIQLQPLVKKLPSYPQDDNHFLKKINDINKNQTLPPNSLLVTWDVKSLYTNIPHKEGLEALRITLDRENIPSAKANTIIKFSELVLTSNHFKFLGQNYLQMSGTAMGIKIAPSYANLFMGVLEQQMLSSYKYKPLAYFRYIDDIFMIWTEGEETLNEFSTHCNNQNKHIQFEQTISKNSIPFLDVSVILENGKLTTDLYSKPTDKHQYLYSTSCHPKHTKTSLPYCLALRLRRICSTDTLIQKRTHEMKHHLLKRGYKNGCIQDAINKASSVTREEALTNKRNQKILKRVPFVITYNPMLPNIPKILNESHTILHASERCAEVFQEVPLVSYRRVRNLCNMLVSKRLAPHTSTETLPTPNHRNTQNSTSNLPNQTRFTNKSSSPSTNQCLECGLVLKNQKGLKIHQTSKHQRKQNIPTSPGFWPCHSDTRCETCKSGLFYTSISSTNNGYKHIIKQPMTCKTKNVCYLINCKKCHKQYTGETQLEFHKRMNNHTSDIRHKKKSMGMVRRFAKCGLNNVQPIILERVRSSDPFIRKAREQFYIYIFGTEINAQ